MKPYVLLLIGALFTTVAEAQWVVTPSAPVSSYSQDEWFVDSDLNDEYMAIVYGNESPATTPGAAGTFMKVFDSSNSPITSDIPVFNMGFDVSKVKISDSNLIYVLGVQNYGAISKLELRRYNTSGSMLGDLIIDHSYDYSPVDLEVSDGGDVLVSLFDNDNIKIKSYSPWLSHKGDISVASAVTNYPGSLRSQFMDYNNGAVIIGYSRGVSASVAGYIKKYNYISGNPEFSPHVSTNTFPGGFKANHLIDANSHQVALRANGDIFYISGLSGVHRISGGTSTLINSNTKTKVNVDAEDNLLITWTDNSKAHARLYNASNVLVHYYTEDGNINGSWAPAFYKCKFVIAGDKSYQGTDYHTNRKPYYQVFNCSTCESGGTSTAAMSFRFPNQVIQMDSYYGPQDVTELCLVDELWVNGSESCNENGYFVELSEFNLMTWTNVNMLYSDWVCTGCTAPNNIDITNFLPQGYQLRPNKIYRFKLAVGPAWSSISMFFKISCCEREIIGVPIEDLPVEIDTVRSGGMGEQDPEQTLAVSIFPIPSEDEVTLDLSEEEDLGEATISIANFEGEEIYTTSTDAQQLNIDISSWEPGIYFCKVKMNGKTSTKRFVKQ